MKTFLKSNFYSKPLTAILLMVAIILLTSCQNGAKTAANELDRKKTEEAAAIISGELAGEITVSCYNTQLYEALLNDAKASFEAKYPGTTINIEAFAPLPVITTMENDDGTTTEVMSSSNDDIPDYVNRVTTDIMGGKGADIYAMDELPYYKYAQSGSLEDMRYFMEADPEFDTANYRTNILEGARFRGGQYMLPLDFHFSLMLFDKEKAGEEAAAKLRAKNEFTYWEMTDIVKERFAADESGAKIMDILFMDDLTRIMFNDLMLLNMPNYVNREDNTVNFADGKFAEFLTKFKEQADNNYFKSKLTEGEGNTIAGYENPNNQIGYYFKNMLSYEIKYIFLHDAMTAIGKPEIYSYFIKPNDEKLGVMVNDNGQGAFEVYASFAMNSNSANKKLAWEFMKFLLGEEMQTSIRLLGIPVNKTAYERFAKQYITEFPNIIMGETENEYSADGFIEIEEDKEALQGALAQYKQYMEEIIPKLTYSELRGDGTFSEMISEEAFAFFNGEKTAEEAAQELQNKIGLYLNE
ncbi:MAG: extracellular solute-binding protein [Clostridiales bacterium]|jgi:multiple sugar transport system substrate-binding protein|nr:extracellular solute-binding protein [Clostridiales bacterium]